MTATAIQPVPEAGDAPRDLGKATIFLDLHISLPGFRRKMRPEDVMAEDETIDPNMLHLSKDLLDTSALSEIVGERDKLKRWLKTRALPCKVFRGGMVLLPLSMVEEVDERVGEFIERFNVLRDKLLIAYEGHKQDAEKRLGEHYNAEEYPSLNRLANSFDVQAGWRTFDIPAALKTLKRSLYEREREKVKLEWAEASEDIKLALRESLAGLVAHFVDRLGIDDQGNKATFRGATLDKLKDFLGTFEARNLTGDDELADLARQAKDVLRGVEPDALRKQDTTRDRVRGDFEKIKAQLDLMLAPAKRRRFAGEEEV